MAENRFEAKDVRALLLWIVLGLADAGVAFQYFFQAFPEASVDFRVSRPAALEVARSFLTAQDYRLEGYQSSIVFRVDDGAKTYLEREIGLEQANRLMAGEVSVWHWDVRFFRPGQKEEFEVRVSPAGRVVGMKHVMEEARAGARLDEESAFPIALAFLRDRLQVGYGNYDFLSEEANSIERPNRRDWSFTWERHGFRTPPKPDGAPYRLRVTVQGDRADGCAEFLKVPEAWLRDYERLRSSNIFYEYVALVPYALLYGALLWVLFELGRRGLIRWRAALKLGVILAVLFFAMFANQWPLARASYDTNTSYAGFLLSKMVLAALLGLGAGLVVALTLAGGEPLYRHHQPDQLRLNVAFSLPGMRSKEFFRSCVIGLAFAAAHIGFVVLFYLVGRRFGVWAPQDINYTNAVSTAIPWIFPLTIGVYAATSEEFLFRLFAIPLLLRFTRSRFLAVLIPAFVWGFLHSSYPQQPGYIRGIEVGVIGIVAGVVMLRWGILATLVWHYTVDALLISLFLLRSGSLYFRVSGAVVGAAVLIPLAVSGAFYLARRRFEADESLLNRAEPLVEAAAEPLVATAEPGPTAYQALSARILGVILGCGVLGVLVLAAGKAETIGDFVRFSVSRRQVAAMADEVLRQRKIAPATYKRATTFVNNFDGYANEYLRRQIGIAAANRLYQGQVPSAFWRVRYFRDSQKEEYAVILRTDGALHSVHHELAEKTPGASLTKEEAQARAEAFLCEGKKLGLAQWKLVEAKSEKRPARTDHTLTWEALEPIGGGAAGADAAHVRIELQVQGDEVSGYRVFVKLPEAWERRQQRETLASTIYFVGRIVFYAALGILVLVIFFKNLKQPAAASVPWRRLALWSLWGLLASLVTTLNKLPLLLARYPTEFPFKTYVVILVITVFLLVGVAYSALFFLLGLAWFFVSRAFGAERLPAWRGMPAVYYRDAFCVALGGTGILLGLSRLASFLARVWPTAQRTLDAHLPTGLDSYLPAVQAVGQAIGGVLSGGLFLIGLIALAAGFIAGCVRQQWVRLGLALLLAVALAGEWGSPADFARRVPAQLILLAVVWWGVARVVRFNMLAYFLTIVTLGLVGAAGEMLRQPNAFFRANGYAVVAFLLVLLAWPLIAWLRSSSSRGYVPGPSGPAA